MADNLKPGDIVYFPSHPKFEMTVESVESPYIVLVAWFHPITGDLKIQRVHSESLIKVQP
jgi:hypothetical protein